MAAAPSPARVGSTRPPERKEAAPEPAATPRAKAQANTPSIAGLPPSTSCTSAGVSDNTAPPAIQNQVLASAARQLGRSARSLRSRSKVARGRSARMRSPGAVGAKAGMAAAASQDAIASATTTSPTPAAPSGRNSTAPAPVPARMAMNVAPSTNALAAGRRSAGNWSGRMPYFTGPNSAAITPAPTSASISKGSEPNARPAAPAVATTASANFRRRASFALSIRSASSPARLERRMDGATKAMAATGTTSAAADDAAVHSTDTPMALRNRLSPSAERNWHRNSGANRRSASKDARIIPPPSRWPKGARRRARPRADRARSSPG